jgi:osmotically-inducible protein OsmY
MKKFICLTLLISLNVLFTGCDERGRLPDTRTTRSPATAPSTSTLSDSDLKNAARAKLESDAQLTDADLSVIADAARNEITLSGIVRTHAAREKAIELVKSAKPGVLVNDKTDVKTAG